MKKRMVFLVLFVTTASFGYLAYAKRLQIEAGLWHWRHGHSTIVGDFSVPVPDGWLVTDEMDGDENITLVETNTGQHGTMVAYISVTTMRPKSSVPRNLTIWESSQQQFFGREGLKNVEEHTLHFDGETVLYMGGNEARDVWKFPKATLLTLGCMSTSPLNFLFVGSRARLGDFDTIVSQIHRR